MNDDKMREILMRNYPPRQAPQPSADDWADAAARIVRDEFEKLAKELLGRPLHDVPSGAVESAIADCRWHIGKRIERLICNFAEGRGV